MVSPAPMAMASAASPRGRRRMNQLLIAVWMPSSKDPRKSAVPERIERRSLPGCPREPVRRPEDRSA